MDTKNLENKKEEFYIFLDFDGVLNDLELGPSKLKIGGFLVNENDPNVFNPSSIDALNYLIKTLETKYEVKIVFSTTWRRNMIKAVRVIFNNGLEFSGDIYSTPNLVGRPRALEILKFSRDHNIGENYLIIDDKSHLPKYFPKGNIIKTNIIDECLNMDTVSDYLTNYQPNLMDNNPFQDEYGFNQ